MNDIKNICILCDHSKICKIYDAASNRAIIGECKEYSGPKQNSPDKMLANLTSYPRQARSIDNITSISNRIQNMTNKSVHTKNSEIIKCAICMEDFNEDETETCSICYKKVCANCGSVDIALGEFICDECFMSQ